MINSRRQEGNVGRKMVQTIKERSVPWYIKMCSPGRAERRGGEREEGTRCSDASSISHLPSPIHTLRSDSRHPVMLLPCCKVLSYTVPQQRIYVYTYSVQCGTAQYSIHIQCLLLQGVQDIDIKLYLCTDLYSIQVDVHCVECVHIQGPSTNAPNLPFPASLPAPTRLDPI